jgi:hypothetical protein
MARELGHGDIEITDELKNQATEVIISDQESTLDNWVDYLTSSDSDSFPTWAKYWAFTGMLKLSAYDKEKHAFGKRDKNTVAPFPDLNREALAYAVDAVVRQVEGQGQVAVEGNPELAKLLQGANFGRLYAYAIEKVTPAEEHELLDTRGEWVRYPQNSNHMPLVQSLQGYGTNWCTAGETTAKAQLAGGDFYVYYSLDKDGQPTIPRIAIRMQGHNISEVRGVASEQNLDPYITKVVDEKLKDFPDGEKYQKKTADMKHLTDIEKRQQMGEELTAKDLKFLYEIDSSVEGFGYQKDPRIAELRGQRNPEADAPIVFGCAPEQIAHSQADIHPTTKVYIGPLFPGIFKLDLKHIATKFPEGLVREQEITIGGKTKDQLVAELTAENLKISSYAAQLLDSPEFETKITPEPLDLIELSVADLGFPNGATTEEIYTRAEELGLELCPAEVGLHLRLQDKNPVWRWIAMKPIADAYGRPEVFFLYRDGDGLWLCTFAALPGRRWGGALRFVFRRRK